ncbi:MAG: YkgJ family cysteine cluster protein [Bacillota bacterium]
MAAAGGVLGESIPSYGEAEMARKTERDNCIRCGACCLKGGPILHHEDRAILLAGHASYRHLITIRKDELAFDPTIEAIKPVEKEMVKVRGKGDGWSCCLYDEKNSTCLIYESRFLECRLLKCWDTAEIISVIGKDTITRADIIDHDDPVMEIIEIHERECSIGEIERLIHGLKSGTAKRESTEKLTHLISRDLAIRFFAASELGLPEDLERFVFGRSLIEIVKCRGIRIKPSSCLAKDCPPQMKSYITTAIKAPE